MSLVRDVLESKGNSVCMIEKDRTVLDAVKLMKDRHIGSVIVMQGETVAGIFTERDLMCRVVAAQKDPTKTLVGEVMTARVAFCIRETTLEACRSMMTRNRLRHLPVLEEGRLLGIISSGDILARELKDQEETLRYLHDYMRGPN